MISFSFVQGLLEMLNMEGCKIHLDKESVPYPNFSYNTSIAAIFPEDNIIFVDKDAIYGPSDFYALMCMNIYDLKLAKTEIGIMDRARNSRVFTYYIMKTVFNIETEENKDEEFYRILENIQMKYPEKIIHEIMEEFYEDIEDIKEMVDEESPIIAFYENIPNISNRFNEESDVDDKLVS